MLRVLLDREQPNDLSSVFPLARLLKEYQKLHARLIGLNRKSASEKRNDKLTKSQFFKASFHFVKGAVSAPLFALARNVPGPLNQPIGSISTDPAEVDRIVTSTYKAIYDGNFEDEQAGVDLFLSNYEQHIFKSDEFPIAPIDPSELMATCCKGRMSAGGMDGVSPEDLSLLPLLFFTQLAYLLNAIEAGKPWPEGMLHGHTVQPLTPWTFASS